MKSSTRSKTNTANSILAPLATLLSGTAIYFGAGLHPQWYLMWIAAVPLLLLAPRLPWTWTLAMTVAAGGLGDLAMWSDYQQYVYQHLPLWETLVFLLSPVIGLALGVLLFRSLFRRGRVWLAVLAFPALIVTFEYATESVFGTFGNVAYTQLRNLPLIQLAAVTGTWGIGFIVMVFASTITAAALTDANLRRRLLLSLAALLAGAYGYGAWRLAAAPRAPHSVTVGLVSTESPSRIFPDSDAQKLSLLEEYAAQVRALAARGATIVVLPEMTVQVASALSDAADRLFEQTARDSGAQILLGLLHVTPRATYNEGRLYSPSGAVPTVYRKRHLVPGVEGESTPVSDVSVLAQPEGIVGLAICRDMDYPDPSRLYGGRGVGLLLVPAWDQWVDGRWHADMAMMRGIEYGYSIVRSAKVGLLTVSDDRGRLLAEAGPNAGVSFTTLLAAVPVRHDRTLYQSWGDWFAWLNVALLCVILSQAWRWNSMMSPARTADSA